MGNEQKNRSTVSINRDKILAAVRTNVAGIGGRVDDNNPLPHGPWDPIVRLALERLNVFKPQPVPWKLQPDPWRVAFVIALAQVIIERAELIQEITDAVPRAGGQQAAGGSGYISRFIDDYCGTPPRFRPRFPYPGPPPPWFDLEINAMDMLVMATQFEKSSKTVFSQTLQQNLASASAKLTDTGLAKMQ